MSEFEYRRDPNTVRASLAAVKPHLVDLANGETDELRKLAYAMIAILVDDAIGAITAQIAVIRTLELEAKERGQ